MTKQTCQICERAIKAPKGRIAHHGYRRPYQQGYQTASCAGAGWRPYEVACDAIPPAIEAATRFQIGAEAALEKLLREPPDTLMVGQPAYGRPPVQVSRPVDFSPKGPDRYRPRSYTAEYNLRVRALQSSIRAAEQDIVALRRRLAEWKEVA